MNYNVFYVRNIEQMSGDELFTFNACMQSASLEYIESNNNKYLIKILLSLLNGESYGIDEMASIQISLDEEPVDPICIEKEFTEHPYIVFNNDEEYLVMKLDRGIQLMVDWCYQKLALKPDSNIAILLEKLKTKYVA